MTKREWIDFLESLECNDATELEFGEERCAGIVYKVYTEFVSSREEEWLIKVPNKFKK